MCYSFHLYFVTTFLFWVTGTLESYPAYIGQNTGNTPDQLTVYCRAGAQTNIFTQFKPLSYINPVCEVE